MILVAAGLGGEVDDAAGETPELGPQVVGLDVKFLDGVLRGSQGQDIEIRCCSTGRCRRVASTLRRGGKKRRDESQTS
jgi:hypothetical protein